MHTAPASAPQASPDRSASRAGRRPWQILGVIVVSILVVFLDGMVLNVALPRLQQELGASQSEQEWIVAAYTLVFAALLLPFGVLGDRFGRRRVLTTGLVIFGLGSLAAAYASSPTTLIALRAATGVGAAAILPATLAVITNTFGDRERPRAIAIWAATGGLGVSLGPLVAGALLDAGLWWGSVLLINVPIIGVALVGVRRWIPESRDPSRPSLDPRGVALAVLGLGVLVFGVIRAGQTVDWTGWSTLGVIMLGVAILLGFVHVEARSSHPALDIRWFRQPALATASGAMALAMFAMFGAMLYGIYFLQFDRGYTPLGAGVLLLGNAAAIALCAPLSAMLARRIGQRRVCAIGFVILAASYTTMTLVDRSTPIAVIEAVLVLLGAGTAFVIAPTTDLVMAAIPRWHSGAGSALNSAIRSVGGALGIAVLGSVLASAYRNRIGSALEVLPVAAREAAGESIGGTHVVVSAVHDSLRDHGVGLLDAASRAFAGAMHITAALSAVAVLVALLMVLRWMPRSVPVSASPRDCADVRAPTHVERRSR